MRRSSPRPRLLADLVALVALASLAACGAESEAPPSPSSTESAPSTPSTPSTPSEPAPSEPGTPAPSTPSEPAPSEPAALDPDALAALDALAAPVRDDEVVDVATSLEASSALAAPTLAEGQCALVLEAPVRVLPEGASAPSILAVGAHAFVAAYTRLGAVESVSLVDVEPGHAPRLVVSIPLESPAAERVAAPGLALAGATQGSPIGLAFTDGAGRVHYAEVDPLRPVRASHVVGEHADARFAPAVAAFGVARVVAYTESVPRPASAPVSAPLQALRVQLARVDAEGALLDRHDVTPTAAFAAAPTFQRTAEGRGDLFLIDPRVALSVVHRVPLDADGRPGASSVARPVNLAAEPPSFAVVRVGEGDAATELVAYAATGNAATRAVGLVAIGATDAPQGLVPGLGYGAPLTVRGLARAHDAVFAVEAPSDRAADAPHEVRVRTVRASPGAARVLGEPLVLPASTRPDLARTSDDVLVVAVEGGTVRYARCGG